MLRKLIKHEFFATALYYLPVYAVLLILGLGLVPLARHLGTLEGLFTGLYAFVSVVLVILTFVVTIRRFYTHLLGREGYLMFALPVSTGQNILGKLIPAVVWSVVGTVLSLLSVNAGGSLVSSASGSTGKESVILLICLIITAILYIAATILFFYLCMSIGQLFNTHKFLAAVVVFLVLTVILQILGITGLIALFHTVFFSGDTVSAEQLFQRVMAHTTGAVVLTGLALIVIAFVVCLILFLITRWLLNRKLNLT